MCELILFLKVLLLFRLLNKNFLFPWSFVGIAGGIVVLHKLEVFQLGLG